MSSIAARVAAVPASGIPKRLRPWRNRIAQLLQLCLQLCPSSESPGKWSILPYVELPQIGGQPQPRPCVTRQEHRPPSTKHLSRQARLRPPVFYPSAAALRANLPQLHRPGEPMGQYQARPPKVAQATFATDVRPDNEIPGKDLRPEIFAGTSRSIAANRLAVAVELRLSAPAASVGMPATYYTIVTARPTTDRAPLAIPGATSTEWVHLRADILSAAAVSADEIRIDDFDCSLCSSAGEHQPVGRIPFHEALQR